MIFAVCLLWWVRQDGDVRFLICTDVAARGIDINQLP
jgi:superfamily II DNA/RNA helicase